MKILVIEDTIQLLETIRDALSEEGYVVDTASDGSDGLFKSQNTEYDAIILDVLLPGVDGFAILEQLRKAKQTPVILLTARDRLDDRIKGLDLGADDYLTKPFDLPELFARIRAITRRGRGERASTIEWGEISLNTAKRTAQRNGKPVELTSREYAILETLMQFRGQAVSRNFLYEHLYAEDDATLSNVLDVYICRLRSKFGKNFIRTRRGFGYIIEEEALA